MIMMIIREFDLFAAAATQDVFNPNSVYKLCLLGSNKISKMAKRLRDRHCETEQTLSVHNLISQAHTTLISERFSFCFLKIFHRTLHRFHRFSFLQFQPNNQRACKWKFNESYEVKKKNYQISRYGEYTLHFWFIWIVKHSQFVFRGLDKKMFLYFCSLSNRLRTYLRQIHIGRTGAMERFRLRFYLFALERFLHFNFIFYSPNEFIFIRIQNGMCYIPLIWCCFVYCLLCAGWMLIWFRVFFVCAFALSLRFVFRVFFCNYLLNTFIHV